VAVLTEVAESEFTDKELLAAKLSFLHEQVSVENSHHHTHFINYSPQHTTVITVKIIVLYILQSRFFFFFFQDLHQPGESYVVGREGVLTDDELQAVLKVLVMTKEEFQEHIEKEGWSDAEDDSVNAEANPLSFGRLNFRLK
jgi:hypothetical protein